MTPRARSPTGARRARRPRSSPSTRATRPRRSRCPSAGFVPDGTAFRALYGVGNAFGGTFTASGGVVQVPLAPLSALVLVSGAVDLTPPAAPTGLTVASDGPGSVSLTWVATPGAASYAVYRSLFTGGGYQRVATTSATTFADSGLPNGMSQYYVVRALDAAGNESDPSNEVRALPHLAIDWSNLQWPPSARYTLSRQRRPHRLRPGLHRGRDARPQGGRRPSTHSSATARRALIRTRRPGRGRTPASTATRATTTSS